MARKAMFVTRSPKRRAPDAVARSVEDEAAALELPALKPDTADPGRIGAWAAIIDLRKCQKTAGLIGIA
jgi:hypothetical protein